jgi:ABC-2 type transport system ATP-binding protein
MQEALKDISFDVKNGEFFGIVGRNGSGKSTLLKLLAGIYEPNSGSIQVNGKLTPFIELGVGFNPELTGRENVFLNGALLGFDRKEMLSMYKDIVDFAEIERFMDQKLKNYSSGMQVRLAFSIAIRAQNDILILDEVLAVGDEAFQQKCVDIFEKYKASKKTVVLVSHDMETVRRFCTRVILLDKSKIIAMGEPNSIASQYSKINAESVQTNLEAENKALSDSDIKLKIKDKTGKATAAFNTSDHMRVDMSWAADLKGVQNVGVAIIKNSGEYMFGANTIDEPIKLKGNKITYDVILSLGPGKYYLMAGLFGETKYKQIDFLERGPQFIIDDNPLDVEHGVVRLQHVWEENV